MGRREDGRIARFSGLAAVVVGDPDGYVGISPVNEVAKVIAAAALGTAPSAPRIEVISAGQDSLRLDALVDITCDTLNAFRAEHGVEPIAKPPTVSTESWNRFFLPLAEQWLFPVRQQAVKLLAMFRSYNGRLARPCRLQQIVQVGGRLLWLRSHSPPGRRPHPSDHPHLRAPGSVCARWQLRWRGSTAAPVRLGPQARIVGRTHPDRAWRRTASSSRRSRS